MSRKKKKKMTMVINEKGQGRRVGIVRKLKFNMKKLNCRWQGLNICVERGEGKSPTKKANTRQVKTVKIKVTPAVGWESLKCLKYFAYYRAEQVK